MIPNWDQPKLFDHRLNEPTGLQKSSRIFVCSMADLFGDWVPFEWINRILNVVSKNTQHEFMFLTKNPKKYQYFEFPQNCWLGTSVSKKEDETRIIELAFYYNTYVRKFVSVEPILSSMTGVRFWGMDLVIVGAMTGQGAKKPDESWAYSVDHKNILYKDNIKAFLK